MEKVVDVITTTEVNKCLKEWLRLNQDPAHREYVGIGFMCLRDKIYHEGDMTKSKVTIHNVEMEPVATIQTTDFEGLFKKIYKIRNNEIIRCDNAHKAYELVKKCIKKLFKMLLEYLAEWGETFVGKLIGVDELEALTWVQESEDESVTVEQRTLHAQ